MECVIKLAINKKKKKREVTTGVTRLQLNALASLYNNRLVEKPPVGRNIQIQERKLLGKRSQNRKSKHQNWMASWLIISFTKST